MANVTASHGRLIKELIWQVCRTARDTGQSPLDLLADIRSAKYDVVFVDGARALSVGANGHSVGFAQLLDPDALLMVAQDAYDWVSRQTDPTNPGDYQPVRWMRPDFTKATY